MTTNTKTNSLEWAPLWAPMKAERHNEKGQAVYACFKRSAGAVYATYMSHEEFITEH